MMYDICKGKVAMQNFNTSYWKFFWFFFFNEKFEKYFHLSLLDIKIYHMEEFPLSLSFMNNTTLITELNCRNKYWEEASIVN